MKGGDCFGNEPPGEDVLSLLPGEGEARVNISPVQGRFSGQQKILLGKTH